MAVDLDTWAKAAEEAFSDARHTFRTDART
jgi:hypothetical protein